MTASEYRTEPIRANNKLADHRTRSLLFGDQEIEQELSRLPNTAITADLSMETWNNSTKFRPNGATNPQIVLIRPGREFRRFKEDSETFRRWLDRFPTASQPPVVCERNNLSYVHFARPKTITEKAMSFIKRFIRTRKIKYREKWFFFVCLPLFWRQASGGSNRA